LGKVCGDGFGGGWLSMSKDLGKEFLVQKMLGENI